MNHRRRVGVDVPRELGAKSVDWAVFGRLGSRWVLVFGVWFLVFGLLFGFVLLLFSFVCSGGLAFGFVRFAIPRLVLSFQVFTPASRAADAGGSKFGYQTVGRLDSIPQTGAQTPENTEKTLRKSLQDLETT